MAVLRQRCRPRASSSATSRTAPCDRPSCTASTCGRPTEIEGSSDRYGADGLDALRDGDHHARPWDPRLLWVRRHEPRLGARNRWYNSSSLRRPRLTGEYVLDHHTASQSLPLYDLEAGLARDWCDSIAPGFARPRLVWPGEVVGTVNAAAAAATGWPSAPGLRRYRRRLGRGLQRRCPPARRPDADVWLDDVLRPGADEAGPSPAALDHRGRRPGHGPWRPEWQRPAAHDLVAGACRRRAVRRARRRGRRDPAGRGRAARPAVLRGRAHTDLRPTGPRSHAGLRCDTGAGTSSAPSTRASRSGSARSWSSSTATRTVAAPGGGRRRHAGRSVDAVVSDVTGRQQDVPEQTIGASYGDALLPPSVRACPARHRLVARGAAARAARSPGVHAVYDRLYARRHRRSTRRPGRSFMILLRSRTDCRNRPSLPAGCPSMRLSVLDLVPVRTGQTTRAGGSRHAFGCRPAHRGTGVPPVLGGRAPQYARIASTAPAVLIAHLAAATATIRGAPAG